MKQLLLFLLVLIASLSYGQEYITDNPSVSGSNCDFCTLKKVILTETETKVLIEVEAQSNLGSWMKFSEWTVLMPYSEDIDLTELREMNLKLSEPMVTDISDYARWSRSVKKNEAIEAETRDFYGPYLIKNLGDKKLNQSYNIRSKQEETFEFWLTFNRVPPGVETIFIREFMKNGLEWIGIQINNPNTWPSFILSEASIQEEWNKRGMRQIEGIYENIRTDYLKFNYRFVLAYDEASESYHFIYLDGNNPIWTQGDVMASLSYTGSKNVFKTILYDDHKIFSMDIFMEYQDGKLKILGENSDAAFIKTYPLVQD